MKVDPPRGERAGHVRRVVKDWDVLPDEAVQGDAPLCFTPDDGAEVRCGAYKVFVPPAGGAAAPGVGRGTAPDVAHGIEESD